MSGNNKTPGYIAGTIIGCIFLACIVMIVGALCLKAALTIIQWLF